MKKMGDILLNATTFRFDGSDLMPGSVGAGSFWTGMVDFVGGKSAQEVADPCKLAQVSGQRKQGRAVSARSLARPGQPARGPDAAELFASVEGTPDEPGLSGPYLSSLSVSAAVWATYLSNLFLDKVLFLPAGCRQAANNINRANAVRPWLFLFPALVLLCLYLAYPVFATFWLSLHGKDGNFVGAGNYTAMFQEPKFGNRCATTCCGWWWCPWRPRASACWRCTDRPHQMGQYRQVADLHADGDFLRRRLGDFQAGLADSRERGGGADRPLERAVG